MRDHHRVRRIPTLAARLALLLTAACTSSSDDKRPTGPRWQPRPGTDWQWQLSGRLDPSVDVPVYDIDGFDHSAQTVASGAWNRTGYANPKVDQLLEAARRSLNQAEREKMYGEVQDMLARDAQWVPVYNTLETVLTKAQVKGFTIHPVEYNLGLWKTWLDR